MRNNRCKRFGRLLQKIEKSIDFSLRPVGMKLEWLVADAIDAVPRSQISEILTPSTGASPERASMPSGDRDQPVEKGT
jgi:hypothetical protein